MKMVHLHLDHEITRRKRFHFVSDSEGLVHWRGIRISQLLEWLIDNDHLKVLVELAGGMYTIELRRDLTHEGKPLWPNSPPPF